jgi:hypothetical protein
VTCSHCGFLSPGASPCAHAREGRQQVTTEAWKETPQLVFLVKSLPLATASPQLPSRSQASYVESRSANQTVIEKTLISLACSPASPKKNLCSQSSRTLGPISSQPPQRLKMPYPCQESIFSSSIHRNAHRGGNATVRGGIHWVCSMKEHGLVSQLATYAYSRTRSNRVHPPNRTPVERSVSP